MAFKHWVRSQLPMARAVALVALLIIRPSSGAAQSAATRGPLVVGPRSHVVVMEYEAWFGPNAVTFQGAAAVPRLQSADMQAAGGGYDSADPRIIKQHVEWLEHLGVDAAIAEITNNVSCIFDSEWFVEQYLQNSNGCPALRPGYQQIRDNTGNLYPAWSKLDTPLKLIPMLGGIDANVLFKDLDGQTAFEKEVAYFGGLMRQYPDRNVIYAGKPLMLIYLGAAQDPVRSDQPLWVQLREFLASHPQIGRQYTFRMVAGFLDSQPALWATPGTAHEPVRIDPQFGFWSWVDRLKPQCPMALCPYFPSFNQIGSRVENFTVSIATAGQDGWGCPDPTARPYCADASLRFGTDRSYATLDSFMRYAQELDPIFLIIHQFNELIPPDEGFDADSTDDIEPTNLWGDSALDAVRERIASYRQLLPTVTNYGEPPRRSSRGSLRAWAARGKP